MNKNIWIGICLLLLGMCSCNSKWDDYFSENSEIGEETVVSNLNLLDYLKSQENYSAFVTLLEETGYDAELSRNQILTVWVPGNEVLTTVTANMDLKNKKRLVKNHINNVALYNSKLNRKVGSEIQSLEGKLLMIDKQDGIFSIDGKSVIKANQVCQNGVVHEIEGAMIPRQNIYEYLLECGDNYSIFRDSLLYFNDTIFRPDLSFPKGVDEIGNTIYDSVFVIENKYFCNSSIDIQNEKSEYTLFLPDNSSMKNMLTYMHDYFQQIGREFSQKDTISVMDWLRRAVLHKGLITNYEGSKNRYSVYSKLWRTDKQLVETDYQTCSNGLVYRATYVHIPSSMYMEKIAIYPHYIFYLPADRQNAYYSIEDCLSVNKTVWSGDKNRETTYLQICSDKVAQADRNPLAAFTFKSVTRDIYGTIDSTKVMPGVYKLSASYRAYANNTIKLYINGELVAEFNPAVNVSGGEPRKGKYEYIPIEDAGKEDLYRNGLVADSVVIKAEYGYHALDIKLENSGKGYRMTPEYFVLEPTDANY